MTTRMMKIGAKLKKGKVKEERSSRLRGGGGDGDGGGGKMDGGSDGKGRLMRAMRTAKGGRAAALGSWTHRGTGWVFLFSSF